MYSFQWTYFVFLTMVQTKAVPATPVLHRQRRFMTPTTYPVPTIPGPVRCPLKREIGDQQRVPLDENLMKEIYMREVGDLDTRYLAQTYEDAMKHFHGSYQKQPRPKNAFHDEIRRWLKQYNRNITESVQKEHRDDIFQRADKLPRRPKRIKRNTDGSSSRVEYCTARGSKTSDGYLHMCSSCAMTTVLPDDKFPRYINEVTCDASDCDCFDVRGTSHGKCKVRIHHVKMLRKVPKGCQITILNGQQVITDAWEIFDYPLKAGCECVINKLSMFATFIPKPSG